MQQLTRDDPRIKRFLSNVDVEAQYRRIIEGMKLGTAIPGVVDMGKVVERSAEKQDFVQVDLDQLRVENYQINGHIVFWLLIKSDVDPNKIFKDVIPRGLGQILQSAEVEYWAELGPKDEYQRVWGVWVKHTQLTPANKAYYQGVVPKRWNDALTALRR